MRIYRVPREGKFTTVVLVHDLQGRPFGQKELCSEKGDKIKVH